MNVIAIDSLPSPVVSVILCNLHSLFLVHFGYFHNVSKLLLSYHFHLCLWCPQSCFTLAT